MAQMIEKLLVALLLMLIPPIGILYSSSQNVFPGSTNLWSGLLAFIAVNMVIVFFICMSMDKHEADPAKASTNQSASEAKNSPQSRDKEE